MDIGQFRHFGKKILCVGRNYKALAAEQGNPIPKSPIVFLKPSTSYIEEGQAIKIPPGCETFYHEVELGVVIGTTARSISEDQALDHVAGYALCLDMTAYDFQCQAKADGQPWTLAKGFDSACPVSKFIPKDRIQDLNNVRLWLTVNGLKKQDSSTSDMIFSVPYVISYLSQYFTLEPGDLILTGSPAGAGPVGRGDKLSAGLMFKEDVLVQMSFDVE